MKTGYWKEGSAHGWTGLISKLKTEQQLEMTQVSGGAVPGNRFVSSGIFISRFGSPGPASGLEPAQLSPGLPGGGGGALRFWWGPQEAPCRVEAPRRAERG